MFVYGDALSLSYLVGNCTSVHSLHFFEMLMCNPNHSSNGMPFRFTFGLLLTPILTKTALRDISFRAYTVAWMAAVIVLAIVSVNLPFAQTYPVYSMVALLLYISIEQDRALATHTRHHKTPFWRHSHSPIRRQRFIHAQPRDAVRAHLRAFPRLNEPAPGFRPVERCFGEVTCVLHPVIKRPHRTSVTHRCISGMTPCMRTC